jgi:hypothetical protein
VGGRSRGGRVGVARGWGGAGRGGGGGCTCATAAATTPAGAGAVECTVHRRLGFISRIPRDIRQCVRSKSTRTRS